MTSVCAFLGIGDFCADVSDYAQLWQWFLWWLGLNVVCWAAGWFFSPLRPICGVVILVSTAALVAVIYGMKLGKERERARRPMPINIPQRQTTFADFDWLWNWK